VNKIAVTCYAKSHC